MELTTIIVAVIGLVATVASTWIASKKHTQNKNTNKVLQNVQEVYEKMLKGQSEQNFELMAHITKSSSVIAELHNTNQLLMKANYAIKEEKYQLELFQFYISLIKSPPCKIVKSFSLIFQFYISLIKSLPTAD